MIPLVRTVTFYKVLAATFVVVLFLNWVLPGVLPFGIFQFFFFKISWAKLAEIPWILLLFGPVFVLVRAIFFKNDRERNIETLENTTDSIWTSILAGVFEEASSRWIGFFLVIFLFSGIDAITIWVGGILGAALTSNLWFLAITVVSLIVLNLAAALARAVIDDKSNRGCLSNSMAAIVIFTTMFVDIVVAAVVLRLAFSLLFIPAVDFITQGRLHQQLFGYGWAATAALVSVNWSFGTGHKSQGLIGVIDAWIFGMIMFWLTFNFGLPVAMLVHVGYDILLSLIRAADAVVELGAEKKR